LSVPANAPQEDAVAAFLRALPGDDFLPPAERVAAINALAETSAPVGQDYGVEQMLLDEVDEFAARYWTFDPQTRLVIWSELSRRGAPASRLRELEPGLDVRTDPLLDPDADELARLFRSLFVLPPRDRAIRRNTWLSENAMDAFRWREALIILVNERPEVPALDKQFQAALGPDFDLAAFAAGTTAPTATRSRDTVAEGVADFNARMQEYEEDAQHVHEAADKRRAKRIFLGAAIAAGLLILGCCLSGITSRTNRSGYVSTPGSASQKNDFTPSEIEMFKQYERDQVAGKRSTMPPGYVTWIRLNRPSADGTKSNPQATFTITFNAKTIQECWEYDQRKQGPKPAFYDYWVKLGRPTSPGSYPLPR
jgi:hypothetical protein